MSFRIRRIAATSPIILAVGTVVAVLMAFVVAGIILAVTGRSVYDSFFDMYAASFGTPTGWEATLTRAAPLSLTALAVATAQRMQLWNIGGEGQLLAGATGAMGAALALPNLPAVPLMLAMIAAGGVTSAAWALIAAVPRAFLGVNEIVVTLFLNYIAIRAVSILVYGAWKDPGAVGFAYSKKIPEQVIVGDIPGTGVSWSVVGVVVLAVVLGFALDRSRWGFGIDIAGGNPRLSRYLGFSHRRRVITVMAVSGALAGLAGLVQLTSSTSRLQPDLAAGYGYTGILVAFLAGRRIPMVLIVAVLFAGLLQGGIALQSNGVPSALANVIQALVIFFVLIVHFLAHYRIVRTGDRGRPQRAAAPADAPAPVPASAGRG